MYTLEFIDEKEVKRTKSFVKIETDPGANTSDCTAADQLSDQHALNGTFSSLVEAVKRKEAQEDLSNPCSQKDLAPCVKKRRLISEGLHLSMRNRESGSPYAGNMDYSSKHQSTILVGDSEEAFHETPTSSYRKPLYGISHKITEKKNTPGLEQHSFFDISDKGNLSTSLHLRVGADLGKRDSTAILTTGATITDSDPNIYSLIQKMFYTLNSLNSSMTQLHSKVDLLSLEVNRIKKHVIPSESVAEFHPPPEYQLTNDELNQIMDQSTSPGDLSCRLLVQLFPELFSSDEFDRNCGTCGFLSKKKIESLHLQLIRNYVEVCYPSVKNGNGWQGECLPQVNDFFNRFWAQREMESSQQSVKTSSFYESDQVESSHYVEDKGQDNILPLEASMTVSDHLLDAQDLSEFLDEASSPGEFAVFLLHRLFPELFDQRRLADRYSCYGDTERHPLDPQRLQVIRRYTEIYFPDVQEEETWLQQCAQRIDDELESIHDESEYEPGKDEGYDSLSLPDDVSVIKVGDGFEFEKPGRRSKKIWLVPIDFDKLEIPATDFEVTCPEYMLSKEQLKSIYDSSLSIGNFASRLLVHLFPELFTSDNLRKQYNCSGSLGKKQLDPVRIKLIRHYVQLLYPRAKYDRVWTLEFVGKLDERCRRRDTEQRRTYQQQRRVHVPGSERRDLITYGMNPERFREEFEGPTLPPERSSKDFCKIPLDDLRVSPPDFPVPSAYLLSDKEIREIVQQSLSVGNFAARLLLRLFPELFTSENLRLQYNHSGACNKKQLDPVRLKLIRHYVEAVYPVEKMEEVWHYECIPSIDERCRRPNRKKCDILKKAKKAKSSFL
ncbi:BEN domain-containing protein 3 [Protopterus annectens]|uniref:BEN domain-containing protein 3 n=1 Tax=Protopterus annectens TaxID=7888 RepID=UPI001CF9EE4E|nr:BEN domain-containing protein 3 [Protopterus annectens]XP_043921411.1 BEN domain-containing protein 3 [Protopterus annectens]